MKLLFFDDFRLGGLKSEAEVALVIGRRASHVSPSGDRRRGGRSAQPPGAAVGERRAQIEWATSIHALDPGDVLALGTNHRGLSAFQDGDRIELETERLGRLRITVRDDLKR